MVGGDLGALCSPAGDPLGPGREQCVSECDFCVSVHCVCQCDFCASCVFACECDLG